MSRSVGAWRWACTRGIHVLASRLLTTYAALRCCRFLITSGSAAPTTCTARPVTGHCSLPGRHLAACMHACMHGSCARSQQDGKAGHALKCSRGTNTTTQRSRGPWNGQLANHVAQTMIPRVPGCSALHTYGTRPSLFWFTTEKLK